MDTRRYCCCEEDDFEYYALFTCGSGFQDPLSPRFVVEKSLVYAADTGNDPENMPSNYEVSVGDTFRISGSSCTSGIGTRESCGKFRQVTKVGDSSENEITVEAATQSAIDSGLDLYWGSGLPVDECGQLPPGCGPFDGCDPIFVVVGPDQVEKIEKIEGEGDGCCDSDCGQVGAEPCQNISCDFLEFNCGEFGLIDEVMSQLSVTVTNPTAKYTVETDDFEFESIVTISNPIVYVDPSDQAGCEGSGFSQLCRVTIEVDVIQAYNFIRVDCNTLGDCEGTESSSSFYIEFPFRQVNTILGSYNGGGFTCNNCDFQGFQGHGSEAFQLQPQWNPFSYGPLLTQPQGFQTVENVCGKSLEFMSSWNPLALPLSPCGFAEIKYENDNEFEYLFGPSVPFNLEQQNDTCIVTPYTFTSAFFNSYFYNEEDWSILDPLFPYNNALLPERAVLQVRCPLLERSDYCTKL